MIIILVIDLCSVSLDQLQRSVHACALSEEAFRNTAMYVRIQQAMQTLLESVERVMVTTESEDIFFFSVSDFPKGDS